VSALARSQYHLRKQVGSSDPSAYADGTDCANTSLAINSSTMGRAKPSSPTLLPAGEGSKDATDFAGLALSIQTECPVL